MDVKSTTKKMNKLTEYNGNNYYTLWVVKEESSEEKSLKLRPESKKPAPQSLGKSTRGRFNTIFISS